MEGIRLFAPDSESFLHLIPSKSRLSSSFYLVVAVQWKPGPIVNNFYNTWWRRWGDLPCDECGSGCGMGSVDYRGNLLSWFCAKGHKEMGYPELYYRQAHIIPGAGSRKQNPREVSRAGVLIYL